MPLEIESHGINAVPNAHRTQGCFGLFAMYAGVNICLPMMLMGGSFVPGMSFWQVILCSILGNAIGFSLTCLSAYAGVDQGLPASVLTRVPLGYPIGTWIPSVVLAVTLAGWFAVQTELAAMAADGLLLYFTGTSYPLLAIFAMGATNIYFAVMGFGWMRKLAAFAVPALIVLSILLIVEITRSFPVLELISRDGDGDITFMQALNIIISGQLAGSLSSSDISRYARKHRSLWLGVVVGVTPVAATITALGALSALTSGDWNPVQGVQTLGLGVGALVLIILATWTTNDKNLYSGGLALTNIFPAWPRWQLTLLLGAVGTVAACFRITDHFLQWLVALGVVFAPLGGVLIADYFVVRKRRILIPELYKDKGKYRFQGGLNWVALAAMAIGLSVRLFVSVEALPTIISFLSTGLAYVLLMRIFWPAHFSKTSAWHPPKNVE
jgi:NCS1 family nucleobase:cation symporter-1